MLVIIFSGGAFDLDQQIRRSSFCSSPCCKGISEPSVYLYPDHDYHLCALICTTQGVNQFIAFAPVVVMITLAMGLDSIVGAAIILLGGAVGFATGTVNPSTTVVAQKIAELPLFSGIQYRAVCFVVFLIITNIYLVRYALKIRKNPELSPMYDLTARMSRKTWILTLSEPWM